MPNKHQNDLCHFETKTKFADFCYICMNGFPNEFSKIFPKIFLNFLPTIFPKKLHNDFSKTFLKIFLILLRKIMAKNNEGN